MNTKRGVLANATLGSRVAEDEVEGLGSYFVETEQWRRVLSGEVDVIFGAKGSGKSALYSLLVSQKETLRLGRRILFMPAENPRGTPAFQGLAVAPPLASEQQFRGLWKLYFASLLANYLRQVDSARPWLKNPSAAKAIDILEKNGLLAPDINLIGRLKAVLDYLRKQLPDIEAGITDPASGYTYTGKIILSEPSGDQREKGFLSADNLLQLINKAFDDLNIKVWLVLDRLDVAFSETPEMEGNALRSLFRTYLDMRSLSNVEVKIFLRDDIWQKLVDTQFREASHITRTLTISWDQRSLQNMIVRRLVHNVDICTFYNVKKEDVLANANLQNNFFYRVFPSQIDIGQKQPNTLDWMLSRTADGSKRTAPREVIHLLQCARDEQLKLYELGNVEPPEGILIDKMAIRQALPAVSKVRYEQTLCAEHSDLKDFLHKLDGEKTQQTSDTLAKLWKCNFEKAFEVAEKLSEAGFFERRGPKNNPTYWVPFLYRDALRLIQGTAGQ